MLLSSAIVVLKLVLALVMASGTNCFIVRASRIARIHSFRGVSSSTLLNASVSGISYTVDDPGSPTVKLFTKEGCTLCDKVKDVLAQVRDDHPHSLEQVDITDEEHSHWYDRYKYDIPVLHVNGMYWIKHRLTQEEAQEGLQAAKEGSFESPLGEPDAAKMERR